MPTPIPSILIPSAPPAVTETRPVTETSPRISTTDFHHPAASITKRQSSPIKVNQGAETLPAPNSTVPPQCSQSSLWPKSKCPTFHAVSAKRTQSLQIGTRLSLLWLSDQIRLNPTNEKTDRVTGAERQASSTSAELPVRWSWQRSAIRPFNSYIPFCVFCASSRPLRLQLRLPSSSPIKVTQGGEMDHSRLCRTSIALSESSVLSVAKMLPCELGAKAPECARLTRKAHGR